jgi:ADP-heptose:LPS heptosyltransferase
MRFLLCRTNRAIGDLVVSLPLMEFLLDRRPDAEIFWMVRPSTAPILDHVPGIAGVLHFSPVDGDALEQMAKLIGYVGPDAFLNLSHRDRSNTTAAKRAGVPMRVAIPRGYRQTMDATHRVWAKRSHSGRHESQLILDFLKPFGIDVSGALPPPPSLVLTPEEKELGLADVRRAAPEAHPQGPILGIAKRGVAGSFPGFHWWKKMLDAAAAAGWNPVVLAPPEEGELRPTGIRGLMGRLHACDAVLGASTGPTHLAAALGVPTLCLMTMDLRHGPVRWAPLGRRAAFLQCHGDGAGTGMDSIDPETVLAALDKLCGPKGHERK